MAKPSFKEALAAKKKVVDVPSMAEQVKETIAEMQKKRPLKKKVEPPKITGTELLEVLKNELPQKAHVAAVAVRSYILDKFNTWKEGKKYSKIDVYDAEDHMEFQMLDKDGAKVDSLHVFDVELDAEARKHL
jgi:pyruvate/2-oxoacid:ferredoxin oxidoreductase alpha subunit